MAQLAYCTVCKATFPLIIVGGDTRSGKARIPACPLGHLEIKELDAPRKQGGAKK
jgi:hypothetical protein